MPISDNILKQPTTYLGLRLGEPHADDPSVPILVGMLRSMAVVVQDNDRVGLVDSTFTVGEHEGTTPVTVTLDRAYSAPISVTYALSSGTALLGSDLPAITGTLIFAPGQTSAVMTIPITDDSELEGDEFVTILLDDVTDSIEQATPAGQIILLDDDTLHVSPASQIYYEGRAFDSNDPVRINIDLLHPVANNVSFRCIAMSESATTDDFDSSSIARKTIPAGETHATCSVKITKDELLEPTETFRIEIFSPINIGIHPETSSSHVTITDDELPFTPKLSSANLYVNESAGHLVVDIHSSSSVAETRTVQYRTKDGSARSGSDYQTTTGTLVFAPFETTATFTVPVMQDFTSEDVEDFRVELFNPSTGLLKEPSLARVYIAANDRMSFLTDDASLREFQGLASTNLWLGSPITEALSIHYRTLDGTAQAGSDYQPISTTVTLAAMQESSYITVPINMGTDLTELDETFTLEATAIMNGTAVTATQTFTIVNALQGIQPKVDTANYYDVFDPASANPPTMTWIEGTDPVYDFDDDRNRVMSFPFAIPFYGSSFMTATLSKNGNLHVGGGALPEENPSLSWLGLASQGIIAPLWDRIGGGAVYTATGGLAPNRFFVIEWRNMLPDLGDYEDTQTFEVVFHEDGRINFNYQTLTGAFGSGNGATIGLTHPIQDAWLEYSQNTAVITAPMTILFQPKHLTIPDPTPTPTVGATATATALPSATPTVVPSETPTIVPSATPTMVPSETPTMVPSATPTVVPSATPTTVPSATSTAVPSATPTLTPSATPTATPTAVPSPALPPVMTLSSISNLVAPRDLVSADFNRDGKPDLAVALTNAAAKSNQIAVLLGDGNGGSTTVGLKKDGVGVTELAAGDINNDGFADLISVSDATQSNVQLWLGNGSGGFTAEPAITTGHYYNRLQLADLNNDGKLDLILAASGTGEVFVRLNTGTSPYYATAVAYQVAPSGNSIYDVITADLDRDGYLDLITANSSANTISVLKNNQAGGFTLDHTRSAGTNPSSVAVLDLNRDGWLDIVAGNRSSGFLSIYHNQQGSLTAQPNQYINISVQALAVADLNQDGKPDLVATHRFSDNGSNNNVSVLNGTGQGSFTAPTTFTTSDWRTDAVVVADFITDGRLDIITSHDATNALSVLRNQTYNTLPAVPAMSITATTSYNANTQPRGMTLADFTNDGKPDIITTNLSANTLSLLAGTSSGFNTTTLLTTMSYPSHIAHADFNRDGKQDLVVGYSDTGQFRIWTKGSTSFSSAVAISTGYEIDALTVGDVTKDGRSEVIIGGTDGKIRIYHNTGLAWALLTTVTVASGGTIPSIQVADINRDGNLDLGAVVPSLNTVGIFLGNGSGGFGLNSFNYAAASGEPTLNPQSLAFVAINHGSTLNPSGTNDHNEPMHLAIGYRGNNKVAFYKRAGLAWVLETTLTIAPNLNTMLVADLNGDGHSDVATIHQGSGNGTLALYVGTHTLSFGPAVTAATGNTPLSIIHADTNRDGYRDIIVNNFSSHTITVFEIR